jgi:hypothetical protein
MTFIHLPEFTRRFQSYRLTDEDLQALEKLIAGNPMVGVVVAGTGGLRKIRFAPPSRRTGKSGAYRAGYAYQVVLDRVYLISIFAKADQANFNAKQKAEMKKLIDALWKN